MIKKILTFIVAYSFVIITSVQLFVNLVFILAPEFYMRNSFYFSQVGGLSVSYLLPMLAVAFLFKFCTISRVCAVAQVILTVLWLVIQEDNVYNITAQITIGIFALLFSIKKIKNYCIFVIKSLLSK
jgi:hypothetical protein